MHGCPTEPDYGPEKVTNGNTSRSNGIGESDFVFHVFLKCDKYNKTIFPSTCCPCLQTKHYEVKPSSCHSWLVKEAHVWTKCDLVESSYKMTKICHIFNTWSWPLYLFVIYWRKDNHVHRENKLKTTTTHKPPLHTDRHTDNQTSWTTMELTWLKWILESQI